MSRNEAESELPVDGWKRIIDRFSGHYFIFTFTGGEPLLYEGLDDLINYTSHKGIVGLCTNGSLLTEERLKRLKTLDYLNLSCDVLSPNGLFKKAPLNVWEMIQTYADAYKFTVTANIVITSKNVLEVPDIIRKLNRHGIGAELILVQPRKDRSEERGHASILAFNENRDIKNLRKIQGEILKLKIQGLKIFTPASYFMRMADYVEKKINMKCLAGDQYCAVNNDGFIMACQDSQPSTVNALVFEDFKKMQSEVQRTVPRECNCWWDCYYYYYLFKLKPWMIFLELRNYWSY